MASDFLKSKQKELKQAVSSKQWSLVEKHAQSVLSFDSNNYNARVFLALALFNLEKYEEAEETYKKAIELGPTQLLARQGLVAFYEKRQRWSDCDQALSEVLDICAQAQDAQKYAETLQKLLDVRRAHGSKQQLLQVLSLLLPSSPTRPLLSSLPAAAPTAPTASPYHSVQLALSSPLPTLLELASLIESQELDVIESETKKRRQRLGGPTLSATETRRQVESEQMRSSQLPLIYKTILEEPDASHDDELRRRFEKKLLVHFRTLLRASPSSFDEQKIDLSGTSTRAGDDSKKREQDTFKDSVRGRVEELAKGMVLIGVPEQSAWQVVIEWQDSFAESVDWRLLDRYAEVFPDDGLSRIAHGLRQRMLAENHAADVESGAEPISAPDDDEMSLIIEQGLESARESVVAHLLAVPFFVERQEWDAVVQVAEAGLSTLRKLEAEIGKGLPRSHRALESQLAIGLVHHESPDHHLRALRMLESLLTQGKTVPLLVAKAFIMQSSERWTEAISTWTKVLSLADKDDKISADSALVIEAQSERGWSLYNDGQYRQAKDSLDQVVDKLEQRERARDQEQKQKEIARSKAGLAKDEAVEEGETRNEALERAKAWYRVGMCLWEQRKDEPEMAEQAYEAFVRSLKARSDFAPSFTSLGLFYKSLDEPDYDRASKCFQKAFELDGGQELAARNLAEEYALVHEWSLVETVARRVVANNQGKAAMGAKAAKKLAWAYKAIGGSELTFKHYPQAITAFQAALRGEPDDVSSWIKLGVAYRHSGKHVAALKVFARALELDPKSWFATFSIGDVQKTVGLFEPALEVFRSILTDRPDEIGVKIVMAETALSDGLEQFRTGFTSRAEASLVDALTSATEIVEAGSATRIGWKVAGDCLSTLGKIQDAALLDDSKSLAARLHTVLVGQDVDSKIASMSCITTTMAETALAKYDLPAVLLIVAVLTAKMRLLLEVRTESSGGSAWFDLGVSIAAVRPFVSTLDLDMSTDDLLHQAVRSLKSALQDEPMNAVFWNALGVLSFDLSPRLAQHCFIKSIEYNSRSAVPWTNLGLFYLTHGDDDLANQAFLKAQVIDPEWAAAWVGQATLADMANHAAEATTLLEHAVSLGATTPEADIAHATRAFNKFVQTRSQQLAFDSIATAMVDPAEALSGPLFSVTRYLSKYPEDPTALHLNALILEQVGDRSAACESLEKAASILEQLYEVDESLAVEAQFVVAQTNLGRVRLSMEDYTGAADAFEAALSLLDVDAVRDRFAETGQVEDDDDIGAEGLSTSQTLLLFAECKLGLGYVHHFLGEFNSAEEVLEGALEDLDGMPNSQRSALAVALGRVYWAEGEEEHSRSAFLDAPDSVVERSPLFVKLALQALGIVTSDKYITSRAQHMAMSGAHKYDSRLTELTVLQHLVKRDFEGALSTICRSLHARPWAPEHRLRLGRNLIEFPTPADETLVTSSNLKICSRFMRKSVNAWRPADQVADRYRGLAITQLIQDGGEVDCLKYAEKATFLCPWAKRPWQVLQTVKTCLSQG
ncbi:Superkiller protein 3 [Microbotryomycetes sp. JL201]|nr:Superkiller protein 3 [Microbotryomycetes sp. JL201]